MVENPANTDPPVPVKKPRRRRWLDRAPVLVLIALLVVEGFLLLSERFSWFAYNEKKGWPVLIASASAVVVVAILSIWYGMALRFRWRFQFGIRSLFVLVLAVAIPCGWLAIERKLARRQMEAVDRITKLHGMVAYDWQFGVDDYVQSKAQPPGPEWLRKLLGDDFFQEIVDAYLNNAKVTDADLECLGGLTHLRVLRLNITQVTDVELEHLTRLTQLRELGLNATKITERRAGTP